MQFQRPGQMTASVADRRARIGGGPRLGRIDASLYLRVEQPPGHRPNPIEELESVFGLILIDCVNTGFILDTITGLDLTHSAVG
jgi:hypothetical protein